MERKQSGGCCLVPRYGGQQAAAGVSWQMGRIMLKFRPIAPKPAAMAPAPTPAPVAAAAGAAAGAGRGKRKAAAVGGGGGGRRGRKPKKAATTVAPPVMTTAAAHAPAPAAVQVVVAADHEKEISEKEKSPSSRSSSSSAMTSVDSAPPSPTPALRPPTLPLMPVSPAAAEEKAVASAEETPRAAGSAQPVAPLPTTTSCWVTVEDVTSTWRVDGEAPSSAALAAASVCGADGVGDAPAFVSDQWGRVTWANSAFARAVSDGNGDGDNNNTPAVGLAGATPAWGSCAGFTCRVRLTHARSVVAPCDVWRLDAAGCYLWRLDLQAALTLGGGLP